MRRIALMTAVVASLFVATPSFAFEVQSGGVALSPEHVAMLASRMTGMGGPAQQAGSPDGRSSPQWMGRRDAQSGEAAGGRGAMMGFMLSGKRGADAQALSGGTAPRHKGAAFRP